MDGDYRRRDRQQGDKADDGETDDLRNAGEDRHGVQSPEAAATIFRGKTRCLRPIRRQNGRGYRHLAGPLILGSAELLKLAELGVQAFAAQILDERLLNVGVGLRRLALHEPRLR